MRWYAAGSGDGPAAERQVHSLAGGDTGPGWKYSGIIGVTNMNATVNENCIVCGLCAGTCPEVFHMGDDGLAHGSGIPEGQLEAAQEARDGCPVSAISIEA
ncbi:MAG: ferredoxin [Dysosmobacter sp.]|nr:ferredoxin [Dysosmobacter sp.]MDR3968813.1 ferredoxin [Dysosmobacter sp.]